MTEDGPLSWEELIEVTDSARKGLNPTSRFALFGVTRKMLDRSFERGVELLNADWTARVKPAEHQDHTWESPSRLANAITSLRYLVADDVRGDIEALVDRLLTAPNGELSETLRLDVTRVCVLAGLQAILAVFHFQYPAYRHLEPYEANRHPSLMVHSGTDRVVQGPNAPRTAKVLGTDILWPPIGVSASPLTANSDWVGFYANRGMNVLTYKSVRTKEFPAWRNPNWLFLKDETRPWAVRQEERIENRYADRHCWYSGSEFSMANSFGVPSAHPDDWIDDVKTSLNRVGRHQIVILSVMGSPEDCESLDALSDDFANGARKALETGVSAVELNLSCPLPLRADDPGDASDLLYENADAVCTITKRVREELDRDVKLVIKLGYLPFDRLRPIVRELGDSIDAIAGINAMQRPVVSRIITDDKLVEENPAFRSSPSVPKDFRLRCAVSGTAIREYALDFTRSLNLLRKELGASFDIMAMGGVMLPEQVRQFMDAGASSVQCTTAAFANPNFGIEVAQHLS